MENRINREPKNKTIAFKVSDKKRKEILHFCEERDWNVGAFCRGAVEEAMASVIVKELEDKQNASSL